MFRQTVFKFILSFCVIAICGFLNTMDASGDGQLPMTYEKFEEGIYYTIHKGDTLWGISKQFYNNPWLWPDLWERNSYIRNPHWIYPGNRIVIYKKTFNEPALSSRNSEKEETERYIIYPPINSIGFIKKEAVRPLGIIVRAKEEKRLISEGDIVYIRPLVKDIFRVGKRFTVFRTGKLVKNPETDNPIGVHHLILGVVKIEKLRPNLVIGKVIKLFRAIHSDDLVMPYIERSPRIVLCEASPSLKGEIILGEEEETVLGTNQIVYIDIGKDDGVRIGQRFSVYRQEKGYIDPEKEITDLPSVNVGEILVLAVEDRASAALIIKSYETINIGSKIRSISSKPR